MDRRRKKEEQKFMKELAYLQQHILDEEKRRSQRVKDTRSAYTNAHKFYKHERKYLQNVSRLRRANDADEAVKKVQHEKEAMAQASPGSPSREGRHTEEESEANERRMG